MKKQVLIISFGIILLLMSSSCKNGLFTKPLEEVLTSNDWELTAYTKEGNGKIMDYYESYISVECRKKSYFSFFANSNYIYYDKCSNSEIGGKWTLNDSILTETYTIVKEDTTYTKTVKWVVTEYNNIEIKAYNTFLDSINSITFIDRQTWSAKD